VGSRVRQQQPKLAIVGDPGKLLDAIILRTKIRAEHLALLAVHLSRGTHPNLGCDPMLVGIQERSISVALFI
jgi:hypothetical protein